MGLIDRRNRFRLTRAGNRARALRSGVSGPQAARLAASAARGSPAGAAAAAEKGSSVHPGGAIALLARTADLQIIRYSAMARGAAATEKVTNPGSIVG